VTSFIEIPYQVQARAEKFETRRVFRKHNRNRGRSFRAEDLKNINYCQNSMSILRLPHIIQTLNIAEEFSKNIGEFGDVLGQWFPTGVPQRGIRGAAKF
jgi:hypothetical protein